VGCIAAHGLLGLNEQGLTVTRQAIPELDTLLCESAKAGSFDLQSYTRYQHDRVNQCDGLSQYAKSTQDAVRADQRHFDPFSRFKFDNERHDGGQRKMLHKKIQLEEETRQYYKFFYTAQYQQQIAQLKQQINETDKLFGQINEQIKFDETLIKVDSQLLQTGDLKIADLILAINNYLTVRNLKTQTIINKLQLINQLNYWNR